MEFEDLNRGYLSHPRRHDPDRLAAWREGRTGYPLIDACMRCLLNRLSQLSRAGHGGVVPDPPSLAGLAARCRVAWLIVSRL